MEDKKFPVAADAHMRIDGGIGLYKGIPVRILMDGEIAQLYRLDNLPICWQMIHMNDDKLITHSLPLGYFDVKWEHRVYVNDKREYRVANTVAYAARASYRRQKSLTHPTNVSITLPEELGGYLDGASHKMYTPEFGKMLIGEFSTNRDFTKLKPNDGQALSRNFAILQLADEQILLFNGAKIGTRRDYISGFGIIPDYNNTLMLSRLATLGISVF